MTSNLTKPRQFNYGWVIVAAMFFMQTVSSGLGFYNMSVYMAEFAQLLSLPLAQVSFAVTLFFLVGGVSGMYIARLLERVHVRWIVVSGAVLGGFALAAVSKAQSLWHLYVLFTLFGIGYTCVSLVVATTLITQWFPGPNRSVALSVASTGLSFGGVVVTPATAYLFNTIGASATLPWLGLAFAALILPIGLWVVRPAPMIPSATSHAEDGAWTYAEAIRSRFFILLCGGYVFCQASQVGGIAHLYNRVTELADFTTAATAVQVLAVCSILGRFSGGWMLLYIPIRPFTLFNLFLQMAGLATVSFAEHEPLALIGAGLFGVSIGNVLMLLPLWLAEAFPGGIYPRVFALANAFMLLGVAFGPSVMGYTYDVAGYTMAYAVAVALCAVAWLVIFSAGERPNLGTEPAPR